MNSDFIWTKEQCLDAYDELMIKIAMSSYAELEGREILEENERIKEQPVYQVTSVIQKRIRQTVQRAFILKNIHKVMQSASKAASKVAVVFLAVSTAFGTTMAVSAEFKGAIYKLIFSHENQYTLIELDSRTALEFVDNEIYMWEHAYAPTMMPQGYAVSDVQRAINAYMVSYSNEAGGYIDFFQNNSGSDSAIQVDTEQAQAVQTIYINDSEGILVNKNGVNTLVWRIGNTFLSLESNEESEVLISIAKGVKLIK